MNDLTIILAKETIEAMKLNGIDTSSFIASELIDSKAEKIMREAFKRASLEINLKLDYMRYKNLKAQKEGTK